MKRFLTFLFICSFISLSFANECEIKPIVKQLNNTIKSKSNFPLENIIAYDLSFYTPNPDKLSIGASILIYKDNKSITYSLISDEVDGYSPRDLYLKALEADTHQNDQAILAVRKTWNINCENPITELEADNKYYRVFMLKSLVNNDKKSVLYNVFIIPINADKNNIYFLQFKNFTVDDVLKILATINNRGR